MSFEIALVMRLFFVPFQWGEMPTSVAYIGTGQIMGWGNKAIEVSDFIDFTRYV